ncbi:MAG: phage terminase large subunit family protein [Bacillota bacterium]
MSLVQDLVGKRQGSFLDYCRQHIQLDNGQPYDPTNRAPMREIVDQIFEHPHITIEKGEQTGLSTLFIGYNLYGTDVLRRNCIYFGPTEEWIKTFTPSRFDPVIQRSEYLSSRLRGTDQVGLKQIGTNFLYLRGLKTKTSAVSVPADILSFDEVALLDKENMELAEGRLSASELAYRRYFSAPLYEEDIIDELFKASDQRAWMVKCIHCGYHQVTEEHFPGNVVKRNDAVFVACDRCGKPLDVGLGEWVAKHPDRSKDRLGYRIPQLIMAGINLSFAYDRIQEALRKPSKMAQVRRSVAGIPDSGNMQPVNDAVIKRVTEFEPYYLQTRSDIPTFMGIDMGDLCHISIRQPLPNGQRRWVWFQEVPEADLAEVAERLEQDFNVRGTIIDAMPYKPTSKKIVRRLQRWAAIHYFRGDELEASEEGAGDKRVEVVLSEREDSIDGMVDELIAEPPVALLPGPRDTVQELVIRAVHRHLKKLVREEKTTPRGKVLQYKDHVENHFGLSMVYAMLAEEMHKDTGPVKYESVAGRRSGGFSKGAY